MDTLKTAVIHTVPLTTTHGMLTYHLDLHKQLLLVQKQPTFPYKATGLRFPMGPRRRPGGITSAPVCFPLQGKEKQAC